MAPSYAGPVRKFNPGTFQTDEQLKQQFVVRQAELDILVEVLSANIDSPSCQHVMVVAPRGRGKTMLLARLAAELREDPQLSASLLPVRFMEESLEISDMADFWLEAMLHLTREVAGRNPDLAEELRRSREDLLSRQDTTLADQALAVILDVAARMDQRLVLMVENMQDLCSAVGDDFAWQLRGVLQTEPQIMLLGTATARFPELQSPEKAFFEMFRFLDLKPLDTADCQRLWNAVSGEDVTDRTIRPLEILTGGSPRLLVIVAQFARHRSLAELMEELVAVVDEHTEYFRSHLNALAKGERRVYVALIDLWQPSSAGEIASRARMDIRAVSTVLGRLANKGLVGFEGAGNRRRYVATERLYSIYYKLRRERDEAAIVLSLIRFMAVFYTEREFRTLLEALFREARKADPMPAWIDHALKDPVIAAAAYTAFRSRLRELESLVGDAQYAEALALAERTLAEWGQQATFALPILAVQASAYDALGDARAEVAVYEEIEARFAENADGNTRRMVASAMVNKAITLGSLGEPRKEIDAYDAVVRRFGRYADNPELLALTLRARYYKTTTLAQLGDDRAAKSSRQVTESACDDLVRRFQDSADEDARRWVAEALIHKAAVALDAGKAEQAIRVAGEIKHTCGDVADHEGLPFAWLAGTLEVAAQRHLGRYPEAVSAFRSALPMFELLPGQVPAVTHIVGTLLSDGVSAADLLEAVTQEGAPADALEPLKLALEVENGMDVRASKEALELVADIRTQWRKLASA